MSKYWYDVLAVDESCSFGFCPCCGKPFDGELTNFYEIKFCPYCGTDLSISVADSCQVGSMVNYVLNSYFLTTPFIVNDKIPANNKQKYSSIDRYIAPYVIGVLLSKFYNDNKDILQYFIVNNYFVRIVKDNIFTVEFFDDTNYYYICDIILKENSYCIEKEV